MLRGLGCILVLLVSGSSEKTPEKTHDKQTHKKNNPKAPNTINVPRKHQQQQNQFQAEMPCTEATQGKTRIRIQKSITET